LPAPGLGQKKNSGGVDFLRKPYLDYDTPIERYEVYDQLGSLVESGKGNRIDVADFPQGMYIISVNGASSSKFIKQ